MTSAQYRQLPAYIDQGAVRDVWQYILTDVTESQQDWCYFRVNALPALLQRAYGRAYHPGSISRALRELTQEGYIHYQSGTRGRLSMARPARTNERPKAGPPHDSRGGD